jgi:hypothetical protein
MYQHPNRARTKKSSWKKEGLTGVGVAVQLENSNAALVPQVATVHTLDVRSTRMAANAKQGTYLGTTLTGFTAFVAGLHGGGSTGIVVAIIGAGLLLFSAAGFYKIKTA